MLRHWYQQLGLDLLDQNKGDTKGRAGDAEEPVHTVPPQPFLHPAGPDSVTICRLPATIRATEGQSDPKTDRVGQVHCPLWSTDLPDAISAHSLL